MQLHTLFDPRSILVVSDSTTDPNQLSTLIAHILTDDTRAVHVVSPLAVDSRVTTYATLEEVPRSIDLAMIMVQSSEVASALRACAEKGIASVIVTSEGFKESGEAGALLEEELVTIAREHGIHLLGPHSLGIISPSTALNASLLSTDPHKGTIALISQSGSIARAFLDKAHTMGIGVSACVHMGNHASLTESDILAHLASDKETRAIVLYLEDVTDGPALLERIQKTTKRKPVAIVHAGRSERGARAAESHVGARVAPDKALDAALLQAGALPLNSFRTGISLAALFAMGYTTPLTRIAVVSTGGGPGVHTTDLVGFSDSLTLADISEETADTLRAHLPANSLSTNPMTLGAHVTAEQSQQVLTTLADKSDVDAILYVITPDTYSNRTDLVASIVSVREKKPIIVVLCGGALLHEAAQALLTHNIPSFADPHDAIDALETLALSQARNADTEEEVSDTPTPRLSPHLSMFPIDDMRNILERYDLPLSGILVREKNDLEGAMKSLGAGPYVLKAVSASLAHKSDVGAIALSLTNLEALNNAWDELQERIEAHTPGTEIDGMLVQPMIEGVECILSMKRDATVGATIAFGIGGTLGTVLEDTAIRVAPIGKKDAEAMIEEIKGYELLTGANDTEPVKLSALTEAIAALSHLALDYPEIEEVDFNPIFATPQGIHIVDARVMRIVDPSDAEQAD